VPPVALAMMGLPSLVTPIVGLVRGSLAVLANG
jgi:hypothetical protein